MKQDYAKPFNSRMEPNALTAVGFILRFILRVLVGIALAIVLGIDLDQIL